MTRTLSIHFEHKQTGSYLFVGHLSAPRTSTEKYPRAPMVTDELKPYSGKAAPQEIYAYQ